MASFKVAPKPSLEKDLRSLPKTIIVRVMKQIDELANDPLPRKSNWKVARTCTECVLAITELFVGDYRIIYGIDRAAKLVTIHHVRHRRDVYRRL
jgi:mRNA interferase RelE/StbE